MTSIIPPHATEVSPAPALRQGRSSLLKREMPGLDALRGIAVLSVVCYHGLRWSLPPSTEIGPHVRQLGLFFSFGWLGVNLFFVLSGFLITGILIDTRTRTNYWQNFYVRRVLRIMPLNIVTLLLIKLLLGAHWSYLLLCLLYLANYANGMVTSPGYGPLWSLAVEEQFYLGWPFIVRRASLRTLAIICIVGILLSPVLRWLSVMQVLPLGNPYSSTILVCDNLFFGALLAVFLRSSLSTLQRVRMVAIGSGGLGLLLLGAGFSLHWMSRGSALGAAFQPVPFLFIFASMLLFALQFGDRPIIYRVSTPLRFFGYISYGFYLLHMLVFQFFDETWGRFAPFGTLTVGFLLFRFATVVAMLTLVCVFSRRYFEEYFLRLKDKLVPYAEKPAH